LSKQSAFFPGLSSPASFFPVWMARCPGHEAVGWLVLAVCLLQIAVSVSLCAPRGGTLPFTLSSTLIFLAELLQAGTGYGRFLEVHIPLGALILGGVAAQLVWVFRA
jgi:hypothetical protein